MWGSLGQGFGHGHGHGHGHGKVQVNVQIHTNQNQNQNFGTSFVPNLQGNLSTKFELKDNAQSIRKVTDDSSWQALIGRQLPPNAISSYKVRQTKTIDNRVIYGVGTDAIRGVNEAFSNTEFVGYYAHSGNFWAEGKCT